MKGEGVLWETVDRMLANGASSEDIAGAIENFLALKKAVQRRRYVRKKR